MIAAAAADRDLHVDLSARIDRADILVGLDDLPFGLIKLPTKEEAANALPIAYALSVVACWLEEHPADTLSEKYKTALEERLRPLIDYAKTLNLL